MHITSTYNIPVEQEILASIMIHNDSLLEKEKDQGIYHKTKIPIIAQFYAGAVISTIVWWIKNDESLDKKELCNSIISLIFDMPHS